MTSKSLINHVKRHRCFTHPFFYNWAQANPKSDVVAAIFYQIKCFCDATRPAHYFPQGLIEHGLSKESGLLSAIVESEADHAIQLAAMIGHVLNSMHESPIFTDVFQQSNIENFIHNKSNSVFKDFDGYDPDKGLTKETKAAMAVFDRRKLTDKESILLNLGVTLALEIISNGQLIPGEKHCLIDSKIYDVGFDDPEMDYLVEHWGETGAEAMHEKAAIEAISAVINSDENEAIIYQGADLFLESLNALWDTLDKTLKLEKISYADNVDTTEAANA